MEAMQAGRHHRHDTRLWRKLSEWPQRDPLQFAVRKPSQKIRCRQSGRLHFTCYCAECDPLNFAVTVGKFLLQPARYTPPCAFRVTAANGDDILFYPIPLPLSACLYGTAIFKRFGYLTETFTITTICPAVWYRYIVPPTSVKFQS